MDLLASNSVSGASLLWEQTTSPNLNSSTQTSTQSQEDSVRLSSNAQRAILLKDEEVDSVLQQTVNSIESDPYTAMHVHSGLDASRVAALLA